jgi:hypothetical protein
MFNNQMLIRCETFRLPHFKFEVSYSGRYFISDGYVPLDCAKEIYNHPIGSKEIRAGGHCGCVPPEEEAKYFLGYKQVLHIDQKKVFEEVLPQHVDNYIFDNNPANYKGYVDVYHIDTELALYIFVQMMLKNNISGVLS